MEPLFVNRVQYTREMLLEAYKKATYAKQKGKGIGYAVIGMDVLFLLFSILYLRSFPYALVFLAMLVLLVFSRFFAYRLRVSALFKADKGINLNSERYLWFYQEWLVIQSPRARSDYHYAEITGYWQTENLHLLEFGTALVIVDKRAFTQGTPAGFVEFLAPRLSPQWVPNLYKF